MTTKQDTKKKLHTLINGVDERQSFRIYYVNPTTGKRHLYGAFPPIPGLKPGDEVPEAALTVTADSPETAETFLKLRGLTK